MIIIFRTKLILRISIPNAPLGAERKRERSHIQTEIDGGRERK